MMVSLGNLSALVFSVICCSGFSAIMPLRMPLILAFIFFISFSTVRRMKVQICRSPVFTFFSLLVAYLVFGLLYSYQKIETLKYVIVYLAGAAIILSPIKEKFYRKCIKYIELLCRIVAGSILVQILVPNLYSNYLYFLIRGGATAKRRLAGEVASHIYSGVVGEKGEAAFLMVVAIIIVLSRCVNERRVSRKNLMWLLVYFAALMLPAKRMLFAVGVLVVMIYVMLWTNGSKKMIAIGGVGALGALAYIVVSMTPAMNTLLLRFTSFSDDDTANGRIYLWEHALNMFKERKWLGYGYGTYNSYASERGVLLTKDGIWSAHAHNIYYQMLGEIGVIGTLLFALVCIGSVYMLFRLYRIRNRITEYDAGLLFIAMNMVVMTLVYGLTGNVIYYTNQIMFFFLGISICVHLYRKYVYFAIDSQY